MKRSKGLAATRGISGGSDASKGLQQLPADGVLRPLLESLLEGRWVLPGGCGRVLRQWDKGAVAPCEPYGSC